MTPRYVAKRVGNDYVLVRVDTPEVATRLGITAAGVLLFGWGVGHRGIGSAIATVAGAAIAYRGWTGENPLDLLPQIRQQLIGGDDPKQAPSYPHKQSKRSGQLPEDQVDEAAMESFPASDPPASHRSTSQPDVDVASASEAPESGTVREGNATNASAESR